MNGVAQLSAVLLGGAIGAVVGAIFVRWAMHWVSGYTPAFGTAWVAAYLGFAAFAVIGFAVGFMIALIGKVDLMVHVLGVNVLIMVIGFFVQSAIYGKLLKHPETGPIGFRTACSVSIIQLLAGGIIFGVIALIVYAVIR